ncbi:polyprenyl synthetase family protein [Flavobacteriaceae bacterium]|nr:polyprenyl synthetase family protein [Flavobacteriaceae bacterium]
MSLFEDFHNIIEQGLKNISNSDKPDSLYDPVKYILEIGGKRVRPFLALMSCHSFNCNPKKALQAALSIELFHNFTLLHDDIMDSAITRRGKKTVHEKWNINTGILSGDVMLIMAYQLLESYDSQVYYKLNKLLNQTAKQVCEGQQMDMDFESKSNIKFEEYVKMIEYKTAVLLACSLKMGAIIADASGKDQNHMYSFGINLGLAFQFQDDYLDTFGNPKKVGKKIGGDILENKKTVLFHAALLNSNKFQKTQLINLFNNKQLSSKEKIDKVTSFYMDTNADKSSLKLVESYTEKAIKSINQISFDKKIKNNFIDFSKKLMNREL